MIKGFRIQSGHIKMGGWMKNGKPDIYEKNETKEEREM